MTRVRRPAFTLIELLVVIAVIAILIAVLLPAVQQVRERARAAQCLSNLKNLGLAIQNYESMHRVFPPSFIRQEDGNPPPPSGAPHAIQYRSHWTGFHMLLPFIEQQNLYEKYDFRKSWLSSLTDVNDRSMWPLNQTPIPLLICPSSPRSGMRIGADAGSAGAAETVVEVQDGGGFSGGPGSGNHWMAGAPTDYSFSHGADVIRAIPGDPCGPLHYWRKWPKQTRGFFGYNSDCRPANVRDGMSQTFMLGEKAGGLLTYGGWSSSFPTLQVEYPWAMAAVAYFAATGSADTGGSYWVAGPFGVSQDIRLPDCPPDVDRGHPFPINPFPRQVPPSSDERPFYSFQSAHPGGAHFLFGDGVVRLLSNSIDQRVYRGLSTIDGGELVSGDAF